jgi:hypothetical protein
VKQVKLLETTQIPDETHVGTTPAPTATNYAGAVLDLGNELADRLIEEGKAKLHVAPQPEADAPAGETAATVVRTFGGQE